MFHNYQIAKNSISLFVLRKQFFRLKKEVIVKFGVIDLETLIVLGSLKHDVDIEATTSLNTTYFHPKYRLSSVISYREQP